MDVKAYACEIYKEQISRLEGSLPGEQFPQAEGGSPRKWSEEGPLPAQITKKGTDLRTVLEYRAALRPLWRGAPGLQTALQSLLPVQDLPGLLEGCPNYKWAFLASSEGLGKMDTTVTWMGREIFKTLDH